MIGALVLATTLAAAPGPDRPQRILCLGGPVTETVFALGAGPQVVGVDKSSLHPAEARARPQVGYFRAFSAEGALSVKPDLVLALEGAGPPPSVAALRAAGVKVVALEDARTVDAAKARIRRIAEALGRQKEGEQLLTRMEGQLASRRGAPPRRVLFVYARGGGTLNVSGTNTAADAMIKLAGADNAVTAYEGFRPLTAEGVVAAQPDVILMTAHGLASLGGRKGLLATPGIALTPAGKAGRIVALPDLLLLGFGPRLGEALLTLESAL